MKDISLLKGIDVSRNQKIKLVFLLLQLPIFGMVLTQLVFLRNKAGGSLTDQRVGMSQEIALGDKARLIATVGRLIEHLLELGRIEGEIIALKIETDIGRHPHRHLFLPLLIKIVEQDTLTITHDIAQEGNLKRTIRRRRHGSFRRRGRIACRIGLRIGLRSLLFSFRSVTCRDRRNGWRLWRGGGHFPKPDLIHLIDQYLLVDGHHGGALTDIDRPRDIIRNKGDRTNHV